MVVTDADGRLPAQLNLRVVRTSRPARKLGLVRLLSGGAAVKILADAGYQGLGAQTGGRVVTPPHRKFKKNEVHVLYTSDRAIHSVYLMAV